MLSIAGKGLINKESRRVTVYMMIGSNKPLKLAFLIEEVAGEHSGTSFGGNFTTEKDQCW